MSTRNRYLASFSFLLALASGLGQSSPGQAIDDASVRVRVLDTKDAPLAGVKLSVHLWEGDWKRTQIAATTDQQGRAELAGLKTESYLTVAAEAEGWASTAFDMELARAERRELTVHMHRPAKGTVRVLDAHGKPIKGAQLSVVHFNAGDGGSLFYRPAGTEPFPFEPTLSDDHGVIQLPPMPEGSKVELCVFHSDFLPKKAQELRAFDGELVEVKLEKAVELRFRFSFGGGLSSMPENLRVTTSVDAFRADKDRVPGLYLPMILSKEQWHCNVAQGNYERLVVRSESDDYTITPMIFADTPTYRSLLSVTDSQPHEVNFLVRKNVKVRGRVSGYLDGLGENASAVGSTQNLHPTIVPSDDTHLWLPVSFPDIQRDGSFELSLPPGKAKISFGGIKGAIVEPAEFEVTIAPGKETVLPEFKIRQLQNITGQLVDENQKPLAGAIARLYVGVWGSSYVRCDNQGRFSLSPDLIIETAKHQASTMDISVLAFDTKSTRCALQSITKDWQKAQDLVIACEPRPAGWLMQAIDEQFKNYRNESGDYYKERRQELIKSFPRGAAGQEFPDLSNGTWLNAKVGSLKDLRGKFVLLDFWFIGCGPCEAELPELKMVDECLGGDRFSVVSVHVTSQTVENVRQFAEQRGMKNLLVVDNDDGEIMKEISEIGIEGFPSYVLLGPDGRIIHNDDQHPGPSLRMFKLEKVLEALR